MTVRWVADHLEQLPSDSRIAKHFLDDPLNQTEHLLLDLLDGMNKVVYTTTITAAYTSNRESKGGGWKKHSQKMPKPIPRPTLGLKKKEEEKPRFLSGRELKAQVEQLQRARAIIHTEACQKAEIFLNTGTCDCPVVIGKERRGDDPAGN